MNVVDIVGLCGALFAIGLGVFNAWYSLLRDSERLKINFLIAYRYIDGELANEPAISIRNLGNCESYIPEVGFQLRNKSGKALPAIGGYRTSRGTLDSIVLEPKTSILIFTNEIPETTKSIYLRTDCDRVVVKRRGVKHVIKEYRDRSAA